MTDPHPAAEPAPTAAHAFEALRAEVSLLRRAVEGLTAERQVTPDYRPTLEVIAQHSRDLIDWAGKVSQQPGIRMGPKAMAEEIVKAGAATRQEDAVALTHARHGFDEVAREMRAAMQGARTAEEQDRWVLTSNAITLLVGMLIASIAPGPVARALPGSWAVPDRIAAHVMGRTRWQAGAQMMATADPERWAAFVAKIQPPASTAIPAKRARLDERCNEQLILESGDVQSSDSTAL